MTDDISKKAVMILVIVAMIISILSTTFVLNAVYNVDTPKSGTDTISQPIGKVSLTVPQQPTTGRVTLTVNNPDEEAS